MLTLTTTLTYAAPATEVAALYADPSYANIRAAAFGATVQETSVRGTPEDGFTVTTLMSASTEALSPTLRRFAGASVTVTDTQTWTPVGDGSYRGTISMATKGVPASLDGTFTLTDTADGSLMSIDAALSVAIPFVGSAIEKTAEKHVSAALAIEQDASTSALAKRRG